MKTIYLIQQANRVKGYEGEFSEWSNLYAVDTIEQAQKDVENFKAKNKEEDDEFLEFTYQYEEIHYYPEIK